MLAEDLYQRSQETLAGIFQFLGVDDSFQPADNKIYNKSGKSRSRILSAILARPTKMKEGLKKILPTRLRDWIWFALLNVNTGKKDEMDPQSREYLAKYFRDDIAHLEKTLGIQTHWLDP